MIDEILPDALHGERLDRVVAMLDGCSRSVAAALIADGKVAIDGDPVTQRSIRVTAGQHIVFAPTVVEVVVLEADLGRVRSCVLRRTRHRGEQTSWADRASRRRTSG